MDKLNKALDILLGDKDMGLGFDRALVNESAKHVMGWYEKNDKWRDKETDEVMAKVGDFDPIQNKDDNKMMMTQVRESGLYPKTLLEIFIIKNPKHKGKILPLHLGMAGIEANLRENVQGSIMACTQ